MEPPRSELWNHTMAKDQQNNPSSSPMASKSNPVLPNNTDTAQEADVFEESQDFQVDLNSPYMQEIVALYGALRAQQRENQILAQQQVETRVQYEQMQYLLSLSQQQVGQYQGCSSQIRVNANQLSTRGGGKDRMQPKVIRGEVVFNARQRRTIKRAYERLSAVHLLQTQRSDISSPEHVSICELLVELYLRRMPNLKSFSTNQLAHRVITEISKPCRPPTRSLNHSASGTVSPPRAQPPPAGLSAAQIANLSTDPRLLNQLNIAGRTPLVGSHNAQHLVAPLSMYRTPLIPATLAQPHTFQSSGNIPGAINALPQVQRANPGITSAIPGHQRNISDESVACSFASVQTEETELEAQLRYGRVQQHGASRQLHAAINNTCPLNPPALVQPHVQRYGNQYFGPSGQYISVPVQQTELDSSYLTSALNQLQLGSNPQSVGYNFGLHPCIASEQFFMAAVSGKGLSTDPSLSRLPTRLPSCLGGIREKPVIFETGDDDSPKSSDVHSETSTPTRVEGVSADAADAEAEHVGSVQEREVGVEQIAEARRVKVPSGGGMSHVWKIVQEDSGESAVGEGRLAADHSLRGIGMDRFWWQKGGMTAGVGMLRKQ